ncbi:hypothetical protein DSM104440_00679 [Usitatibacter palustris]|uniref:Spore coat protein U (SCPU) domain-containing protein n=2 Tax=Usitatibacter palustris TaxID=2732487 RepID=A0A6M4H2V7_9PROT|nr:hypothetical protein DSM104440_00679 [Usitatibacter palustris]
MRRIVSALLATGALLGVAMADARAGTARSDFTVKVAVATEFTVPPESDFCVFRNYRGAFGATVTVVCDTGVVVDLAAPTSKSAWPLFHGGAYRFMPPVSGAGLMAGIDGIPTSLGTSASWRVIRTVEREYLELTLHW